MKLILTITLFSLAALITAGGSVSAKSPPGKMSAYARRPTPADTACSVNSCSRRRPQGVRNPESVFHGGQP